MRAYLLLFLLVIVAGCTHAAATGTLSGKISCTGCSLAGRQVIVQSEDSNLIVMRAPLNADGTYSFTLPAGRYLVDATDNQGKEQLSCCARTVVWWPQAAQVFPNQVATQDFDLSKPGVQDNVPIPGDTGSSGGQ